jgi:hypothetical protein
VEGRPPKGVSRETVRPRKIGDVSRETTNAVTPNGKKRRLRPTAERHRLPGSRHRSAESSAAGLHARIAVILLRGQGHCSPSASRNPELRGGACAGFHLPSPGGGGSIAQRSGWSDGLSTRAPFERRGCHPTPPLISFASTLPLQGRVRGQCARNDGRGNAPRRLPRRTTPGLASRCGPPPMNGRSRSSSVACAVQEAWRSSKDGPIHIGQRNSSVANSDAPVTLSRDLTLCLARRYFAWGCFRDSRKSFHVKQPAPGHNFVSRETRHRESVKNPERNKVTFRYRTRGRSHRGCPRRRPVRADVRD